MRRATKDPNSKILEEELKYIVGNSTNNKRIAEILLSEQKKFCAYTDECINRADAKDIEHFDPTLKGTPDDNYLNWFLVKHQWNNEKPRRWEDYQPILNPTAEDFEQRIIYDKGDYLAKDGDEQAKNLVKLLHLDDIELAEERKQYIKRKREEITAFGQDPATFFSTLLSRDRCRVIYPRAIREEFKVDVLQMIE